MRAAFPEGIQSSAHWCHSAANLPDRETKGPHVALRKLSVRQSAAAMTSSALFFQGYYRRLGPGVLLQSGIHIFLLPPKTTFLYKRKCAAVFARELTLCQRVRAA